MKIFSLGLYLACAAFALAQTPTPDLLRDAMAIFDPWHRAVATSEAVLAMSGTEVEAAIDAILSSPPTPRGDEILPVLWIRFGALAGKVALDRATEGRSPLHKTTLALKPAAQGWAEADPEAAWGWALSRYAQRAEKDGHRGYELNLLGSILVELGHIDLVLPQILNPELREWYLTLLTAARYVPDKLGSGALSLPPGSPRRTRLLTTIGREWALWQPSAAAVWARSLDPAESTSVVRYVLRIWRYGHQDDTASGPGRYDAQVAEWLLSEPAGRDLDSALVAIGTGSRLEDTTREQLIAKVSDSEARDSAYETEIQRALRSSESGESDPEKAAALAIRITNRGMRAELLGRIVHEWELRDPEAAGLFIRHSPYLTNEERQWLGRNLDLRQ